MKKLKKVVHITTAHQASDHRIFHKECVSLAHAGYETVLIAPHAREEIVKDVRIIPIKRPTLRLERILGAGRRVRDLALKEGADLYHLHDPELIPLGLKLKRYGGCVVYDIHEITSYQISLKNWIPKPLRWIISFLFERYENAAVRTFDGVSVPQQFMVDRYGRLNPHVALTRNFAITDNTSKPARLEMRPFIFYPGGLTRERGLLNMVRAMGELRADRKLVLAGPCDDVSALEEARALPGWESVDYRGVLSHDQVATVYAQSSIGLILFKDLPQYRLGYAVKLFEYMLWGMPVIMPNFGDWPAFNKEVGCGICVDVEDAAGVAREIDHLIDDPELAAQLGNAGYAAVRERFSWSNEVSKLLELYADLM